MSFTGEPIRGWAEARSGGGEAGAGIAGGVVHADAAGLQVAACGELVELARERGDAPAALCRGARVCVLVHLRGCVQQRPGCRLQEACKNPLVGRDEVLMD